MGKSSKEKDGKSGLEAAYRAFEAGDVLTARKTARAVISAATPDDQAAARKVGKLLHGDDDKGEAQAEQLAQEIVGRSLPVLRPYLWAIGGVTVYALLVVMALVRYG